MSTVYLSRTIVLRTMKYLIKAEDITVVRDQRSILKNVSLEIAGEDFITIIGPNGAGKSMLLKCLMGFYKPDSGRVLRPPNLRIGYLPQRLSVDQSMPITVKGFLRLRKKTTQSELEKVVDETSIQGLLNHPLFVLSGGELQRVLLARALLENPQILILDEPAQNLDVSGQLAFYKLIEKIHTLRQLSLLMVSHDLHLVMSSTKKVVCLYHHVCCSGEPQVVTKDPEFISLFGDDMARLMSVYHHSHDHHHGGHDTNDHHGHNHV